jgi:hypothetical protein
MSSLDFEMHRPYKKERNCAANAGYLQYIKSKKNS